MSNQVETNTLKDFVKKKLDYSLDHLSKKALHAIVQGSHPILLETNHFESGQNRAKTAIGRPKTARSPNLFTRNFGVIPLWKSRIY